MSSTPPDPDVLPRSVVEAWRADTASISELRRGYARFMRRRPKRDALPRVAIVVVGGLVLGIGLAQAASIVQTRWLGQGEVAVTLRKSAVPSATSARPVIVRQEPAPIAAPAPVPVAASHEPRLLPAPSSSPAAQPYVQQQWQRAAAALRDDDFERAQSALLEIERSGGRAEGDAAQLARAQLLASHGQDAQALALASVLAERAESALVRDKARALVARLSKNQTTDRSVAPGAAVKQP